MNRNRTVGAVALLAVVVCHGAVAAPTCSRPTAPARVLTASNCFYDVSLSDGLGWGVGAYTGATGVMHPVTIILRGKQDLGLAGGNEFAPASSTVSVRSWTSGYDYQLDNLDAMDLLEDRGFTCRGSNWLPPPEFRDLLRPDGQVVGLEEEFLVDQNGDHMRITLRMLAHGSRFADAAVELTTTVDNLGTSTVDIGVRYDWDLNIFTSGGAAIAVVPPDPPIEPWIIDGGQWLAPAFDHVRLSPADEPSREPYYYFVGCSVVGPWPLEPPPTPPDRLVRAAITEGVVPENRAGPGNTCFAWEPPLAPGPPSASGPQGMAYYWGDTPGTARSVEPGATTSVTVWLWAFTENPVTCDAGGPYGPVECSGAASTARLDARATVADGRGGLQHRWSASDPAVTFDDASAQDPDVTFPGPGLYEIELDVGIGPYTRACRTEIEVVDTTPPDLHVPSPIEIRTSEVGRDVCAVHLTLAASARDACDPDIRITHVTDPDIGRGGEAADHAFPRGTTRIVFTAEDEAGNATVGETSVTVLDDTPPDFVRLGVSPAILWPPNHRLVDVAFDVAAVDNCDASPRISLVGVASSEPDDSRGDGHHAPDVVGAALGMADMSVKLRAERDGRLMGRRYTITYAAEDADGNSSRSDVVVRVPHDRRPTR
jgi:hypothetical protein